MRSSLCLSCLLALLPGLALAQPDGALIVAVDPHGFDAPKPSLELHPMLHDEVAGLAPGQDLGGTPVPLPARIAAVDLDSYRNSQAYQQTLSHYFPKKPVRGAGKQLAGLGGAVVRALVKVGEEKIKERLEDEAMDKIESDELPPGSDLAVDAVSKVAKIATVATDMK